MDESLQLSQELKQQQRLTPLQVQFVKMLEMTGPEVEDEVRRAVDENPALEVSENDSSIPLNIDDDGEQFRESAEEMQRADYRTEDDIPSYRLEARNHSADDSHYEPEATYSPDSIIDTLTSQLDELEIDDLEKKIGYYIIGCIDDNGYLSRSIQQINDDLTFNVGLDVDASVVKKAMSHVRSLDPAGICAIDLRDCLLLQINRQEPSDVVKLATEIIADYFDLFSKMHYDKLCTELSITQSQLKEAVNHIRSLNPKPGSIITGSIAEDRSRHIIPDFSVEVDGENITLSLLNNIPELQIEATFAECDLDKLTPREKEAQTFIKQKREEARGFIAVLKMRQETLYNVMKAIISIQRNFFLTEDESLIKPMILKDIEAITGYNVSVISRATSGKYVMTSRGIYPIKLFFNERPKEDEDTSFHEIQAVLKELIASENKRKPMSDEALTAELRQRGYDIARRTVAKYRERLGLPVARLRKTL